MNTMYYDENQQGNEPLDIVDYAYNLNVGNEIEYTKMDSIPIFQQKSKI